MQISPGLYMLEITIDLFGHKESIYPTILEDATGAVLVDAAYPGQAKRIRAAVEDCGIAFNRIKTIIMTHHDIDHMGSLAGLVKALPSGIEVLAHAEEAEYLCGHLPPAKWNAQAVAGMEAQLGRLNAAKRMAVKAVFDNYHLLASRVDRTVADGEELPFGGGLEVIHTPGHSPGHICLYHRLSRTLIAGDALFVSEGRLWATPPFLNLDQEHYQKSLQKLVPYDIQAVICYHGGWLGSMINERIAELAGI